jgi:hypothetical protein
MAALITFDGRELVVTTDITQERAVELGRVWSAANQDDPRWQTSDGDDVVVTVAKGSP